jgi:O-antigen/teichoic acid export membrane protein
MQQQGSLKGKTISGLVWSIADIIGNQGIGFIVQIILARLLVPRDFGVVGMLFVFIAVSNIIINSGFTQALVREQKVSQEEYSTVFHFNFITSLVMYGILYIFSPSISAFFNEPQLISLLRVLSLGVIINSFGIIQNVLLIKNVDFKSQTKINLISGILSGIIAVIFAIYGFGVWSLVIKTLSMQICQVILLCLLNRWKPSLVFNLKSFKRFFRFGSKLIISGIIDTIYNNLFFVLIGKMYSVSQLGYYSNAVKLRDIASYSMTNAVQRVTFPVLSSIKDDEIRLKDAFRKIIKASAFIIFPIMIGLAVMAEPLITLIFGQKWVSMAIYFQLLCFAGMLFPIHSINFNILQVKGRSDLSLLLEVINKVLLSLVVLSAVWFKLGVIGLILAAVINSFISLFTIIYFSTKVIPYTVKEQLNDLIPMFIVSIVTGGVVAIIGRVLPDMNLLKLLLQIFMGLIIYMGLSKLIKLQELNIVYEIILPFVAKIREKLNIS